MTFEELFATYWPWARGFARRTCRSGGQDRDDLAQDGMLALWKWFKRTGDTEPTHVKQVIRNGVRHSSREWRRARRVHRLEQHQLTDEFAEVIPDRESIDRSAEWPVTLLTEIELATARGLYELDQTLVEVAADLGVTERAVWDARKRLHAKLREWYEAGGKKDEPDPVVYEGAKIGGLYLVRKVGRAKWRCICVCGRDYEVKESRLRSGNSKSCGCRRQMWDLEAAYETDRGVDGDVDADSPGYCPA